MERSRKVLVAILALVVIVAVAAAIFYMTTPKITTPKVTAEQIKEEMIEATGDINTYQFDMDMKIDMTITDKTTGKVEKMVISLAGGGAIDNVNRKMKTTMAGDIAVLEGEETPGSIETQTYVVNDTVYTLTTIPETPANWTKIEMPAEAWETQNQVEQQRELMKVSEVELLGDERVDGTDCYVLEITPDMEKYWETMMQQPWLSEAMQNVSIEETFKEMSMENWIAKDTYFPIKTETQMTMVITEEDVPEAEEPFEMMMDMDIDMLFHDYNEPVTIELPEDAESAVEAP